MQHTLLHSVTENALLNGKALLMDTMDREAMHKWADRTPQMIHLLEIYYIKNLKTFQQCSGINVDLVGEE